MDTINLICFTCKHYDDFGMGCKAFPKGIPDEILQFNKHDKPLPNQGNNIVYEKIKANETDRRIK